MNCAPSFVRQMRMLSRSSFKIIGIKTKVPPWPSTRLETNGWTADGCWLEVRRFFYLSFMRHKRLLYFCHQVAMCLLLDPSIISFSRFHPENEAPLQSRWRLALWMLQLATHTLLKELISVHNKLEKRVLVFNVRLHAYVKNSFVQTEFGHAPKTSLLTKVVRYSYCKWRATKQSNFENDNSINNGKARRQELAQQVRRRTQPIAVLEPPNEDFKALSYCGIVLELASCFYPKK